MIGVPQRSVRAFARLEEPVDGAGLAAFRVFFGVVAAYGAWRFLANDWIDRFYVTPDFRFPYRGFGLVTELSPWGMHAAFVALMVLGLLIAAGLAYRAAAAAYFVLFSYVELIDVTYYLNHYYLVSLLALLLVLVPAHRVGSVDAWLARRRGRRWTPDVPRWAYVVLRAQVAVVYFHAALAKAQPDWLVHGQPLNLWLTARVDVPVLGVLFEYWWVALAMGWAGFLYDLTIPLWLSIARTRSYAYALVLVFHALTRVLFQIGMFPFIMVMATTAFFSPDWPRRIVGRLRRATAATRSVAGRPYRRVPRPLLATLAAWMLFQAVFPLRTHLYGGNVLWHEQGMRWSWRVMVREKNGDIRYRVHLADGRVHEVGPACLLSDFQEREMSGQPDLIVALGQAIADAYDARGEAVEAVYVDALVALNGRPPEPLIDPDRDLLGLRPSMARADWILPAPETTPRRVGRTLTRPAELPQ